MTSCVYSDLIIEANAIRLKAYREEINRQTAILDNIRKSIEPSYRDWEIQIQRELAPQVRLSMRDGQAYCTDGHMTARGSDYRRAYLAWWCEILKGMRNGWPAWSWKKPPDWRL